MATADYKRIKADLEERSDDLTGKEVGRLLLAEFAQYMRVEASWLAFRRLESNLSDEEKEYTKKLRYLIGGLYKSRQDAKRAEMLAYSAILAIQQELKELATTYRNIKTDKQAEAYSILPCVGIKRFYPELEQQDEKFRFSLHTLKMRNNIKLGVMHTLHYNAMIKHMAKWAGYKKLLNCQVADLSVHLDILNQLTEAVRFDIKESSLKDADKEEAVYLFNIHYQPIGIKALTPNTGFARRCNALIREDVMESGLYKYRFRVDIAALSGSNRKLYETGYFSSDPYIIPEIRHS